LQDLLGFYMGKNTPERQEFIIGNLKVEKDLVEVLTATAGVFAWNSNKKDREAYDALVAAEDSYNSLRVPLAITGLKDQVLPSLQADLDAANRRLTMAVALAGVGVVATILGFIKAGRIVEPTYEDKGKVEFDGLVWMPSRNGSSIQLGMHIPIR
jgi:hypothetical protein